LVEHKPLVTNLYHFEINCYYQNDLIGYKDTKWASDLAHDIRTYILTHHTLEYPF
jgi:hypothetical protein